jgi:hypothetical protein
MNVRLCEPGTPGAGIPPMFVGRRVTPSELSSGLVAHERRGTATAADCCRIVQDFFQEVKENRVCVTPMSEIAVHPGRASSANQRGK